MLCRSGCALALSQDQTANVDSERGRVTAMGARVQWLVDSWRVGDAGIQVTRYCTVVQKGPMLRGPRAQVSHHQALQHISCLYIFHLFLATQSIVGQHLTAGLCESLIGVVYRITWSAAFLEWEKGQ